MHRVTITGPTGLLRWKSATAATLGSWSLTSEPAGGTLTAKVVSVDEFKASQRPLTFVVPRPAGPAWRWPITSLQITATTLTASVGSPEE